MLALGWILNPRQVSIEKRHRGARVRKSCDDGGRDWSYAAKSEGMLGAPRKEEARKDSCRPSEKVWPS